MSTTQSIQEQIQRSNDQFAIYWLIAVLVGGLVGSVVFVLSFIWLFKFVANNALGCNFAPIHSTIFKWICKRNPAALWRRYRDYIQRRRERRENTKDDIEHCRSSPSTASRSPEISLSSQVYASPEKSRPEPVSLLRSIWDRIPFPFNQKGVHYFNTRDERREQARIDREVGYFPSGYASDYVEKGQGQSQGRGRGRQSSSYASGGHSAFSQNYSSIEEPKPVLQQQERVWWRDHPELLGENVLVAIRSIQEEARLKREGKQ